MTALILTIAVAAMLTLTLPARPLVAIPGGLAATLAWWVAASAARDELMTLTAVASLALGCCTAAYAVHDALLVAARERGRLAGQAEPLGEPDETPDPVTLRLLHEGLQAWEPPQPEPEPAPPPERTGDLHPDSSRSVRHQIALDNIYGPDHDHESEPAR